MISTLYGHLALTLLPEDGLAVTPGGRAHVCKVRGQALGHHLNVQITLDTNTGELLLMTPDNFVGSFRIGDLIAAHCQRQTLAAAREREQEQEEVAHAKAH